MTEQGTEFNYVTSQRIFANTVNLTNFAVYNQFTNINQYYNSFQVFINNQTYVVNIPSANYNFWDINDLIVIVQTQLNAQVPVGVWTVALSGNNNRFTLITNSTTPFKMVRGGLPQ